MKSKVPYSGKLQKEKTFTNFELLWLFAKVFSTKFGDIASFGSTSEQSAKVFSATLYSSNLQKFSPAKIFHYTVAQVATTSADRQ